MRGVQGVADDTRVQARDLLVVLFGALVVVALIGGATQASARRACVSASYDDGYSYAGHQAAFRGHGVRATITATRAPGVEVGHVAGWVGVGGPGQGANGSDEWIQAGIASTPGMGSVVYAEIKQENREPEFVLVDEGVALGRPYRIAVLEMSRRPGWWRVWVDGGRVTAPVQMRGSSGRWAPIATAESWNVRTAACNEFGFRFERVSVSHGRGGSWRPFVPGHRFLSGMNELRAPAAAPHERSVAAGTLRMYAFTALSG